MRALLAALLFATAALQGPALASTPLPAGQSQRVLDIAGEAIEVFAYKPPNYQGGDILLVLHGLGTNAQGYRDYAMPLADKLGLLVIAPLFDRKRFPVWRYQTGGIVRDQRADGEFAAEPESRRMGATFLALIDAVRVLEGRPQLGYSLIGHSAGGQTLSRFAAFTAHQARRIVIANPSTWLWPSTQERFPFGFGGLPPAMAGDEVLRRYLAQPITLLLGTADTERGPDLNISPGAERQGPNRLARGHAAFRAARDLAQARGWPFHWTLVEVPGVGHSGRRMIGSEQAATALSQTKNNQ
jgi:pimeloyl-ACP methyl ester carboxylesterase